MQFSSSEGEHRYADLVRVADRTIVGLDFDGTLSPIVDDPARARIHPEAAEVLIELAPQIAAIAVITGRPARQALDLGVQRLVPADTGMSDTNLTVILTGALA